MAAAGPPLPSPPAEKSDGHGRDEDLAIEPERPVVDVGEVKADPVGEVGDVVAPADLPEAGEARLDAQAAPVGVVVEALDLLDRERARPDEAHLPAHHVPELGQF